MKRLLITLSVTLGLTVTALPASATTVDGFNYGPAGLYFLGESCSGVLAAPTGAEPVALYANGGKTGNHSTGRGVENSAANLFGAEAYVSTPSTLSSISFATYHPDGPDGDTSADGYFRAIYDRPNDGFYVGYQPLDAQATGWGTWSNLATTALDWYFVPGTVQNPGTPVSEFHARSIRTLPAEVGAGGGAYVGFGFGCNGRDYYMDDFRISSASGTKVYDFEGIQSRSYITTNPSHHSTHLHADLASIRLVKGQRHGLLGHSYGLTDGVWEAGYLTGTARLYSKSYGRSAWRLVGRDAYYPNYAFFAIKPSRRTRYQLRTAPSAAYSARWEGSASKKLTVSVKRRVKARADSKVVRKGQAVHVTGRVFPKDKNVKISLQRKVRKKWRTIAKSKTKRKGKYSLSARATSTGKWQVRVKSGAAKGNLGNATPALKITVKPPKKKPAPGPPVSVETPVPLDHYPDDAGIEGRRPAGYPSRSLPAGPVAGASGNGTVSKSALSIGAVLQVATQH